MTSIQFAFNFLINKRYRLGHLIYYNLDITSENMKLLDLGDIPSTARQDHMFMGKSWTYSPPHVGFNPIQSLRKNAPWCSHCYKLCIVIHNIFYSFHTGCYLSCPFHLPRFNCPSNVMRRMQINTVS
jgi:hypothetical protein